MEGDIYGCVEGSLYGRVSGSVKNGVHGKIIGKIIGDGINVGKKQRKRMEIMKIAVVHGACTKEAPIIPCKYFGAAWR